MFVEIKTDIITCAHPSHLARLAEVFLHELHLSSGSASRQRPLGLLPPKPASKAFWSSARAKGKRKLGKKAGKGKVKSDLFDLLGNRMRNQNQNAEESIV